MPTDVFSNLQTLSFKGLELPFTTTDGGFSHESAEKKFTFKDQQLIQRLGVSNQTYRYEIPFYDGLAGYGALFTDSFASFKRACLSREPGILVDPIDGEVRAVVATFQYSLNPSEARDGVRLTLELIEAPENIRETESDVASDLSRAVEEANVEFAEIELPPDPQFQEPLVDPRDAVTGTIQQVGLQRDKFQAQVQREQNKVDSFSKAVEETSDPDKWNALERLYNLKLALVRANQTAFVAGKRVTEEVIASPVSLIILAQRLNMSTDELLGLNPDLDGPMIQPGTRIKKFENQA